MRMELSERKKRILCAIVEEYIMTGEPVGSKFLAKISGLNLSSATIRNEMAELCDQGYIGQPHTSAGRVPTQLGYRMYVDHLMGKYSLTQEERAAINGLLQLASGDMETTLEKAGEMLAQITGFAAVSTTPDDKTAEIRRIELVPAGPKSILLVILTSSGVIKSRLCRIGEVLTVEMMEFFTRLVNDRFCGVKLDTVTPLYLTKVKGELYEYTFALSPVIDIIAEEIRSSSGELFIGGAANLLTHREFDGESLVALMKYLEHRDDFIKMLGDFGGGVTVRIGGENGMPFMEHSAVIASPYLFKGKFFGTVGIIGPARINYPKMVSSIEYFSQMLSRLINESFGD